MFKIGEVVSYSATGVCEIVDIRSEKLTEREMQYYILKPMYQNSSIVYVPVENETLVSRIKPIITKKDALELVDSIAHANIEWINNDNERIPAFREILRSGERKNVAALIKCLYERQEKLSLVGKHLRSADAQMLKEAQTVLHGELAMVLEISFDEVIPFILNRLGI